MTLFPFGDLHEDDDGFCEDLWTQFVHEVATTPNARCLGMGDYRNFLRTTARRHLQSYTADTESFGELDKMIRRAIEDFYRRRMKSIAPKLIGLLEGNHHYRFASGETCTQYLCQLCECPYLTDLAGIRFVVERSRGDGTADTLKSLIIVAHHGDWSGSYSRVGGDLNALEMKGWPWEADIVLAGHTHRKAAHHSPIMQIPARGPLRILERPKVLIRTGSFVKGFVDGHQGRYVEKKLLPPHELGYPRLSIRFFVEYDKGAVYRKAKAAGKKHPHSYHSETRYRFEVRI